MFLLSLSSFSNSHLSQVKSLLVSECFSLVVGNEVGRKPTEGANLEEWRIAAKSAELEVDEVQTTAIEHSAIREAEPFHTVVSDIDLR
jgi:hypothetical protein